MCKIGVSGEMCLACVLAERHVVLCCIMGFFFNRGIPSLIDIDYQLNMWNARWTLSPLWGPRVWHRALAKFLPSGGGAQLTAAVLPGGTRIAPG